MTRDFFKMENSSKIFMGFFLKKLRKMAKGNYFISNKYVWSSELEIHFFEEIKFTTYDIESILVGMLYNNFLCIWSSICRQEKPSKLTSVIMQIKLKILPRYGIFCEQICPNCTKCFLAHSKLSNFNSVSKSLK